MTLFDEPETFKAEAGANRLAEQLALAMAEARRDTKQVPVNLPNGLRVRVIADVDGDRMVLSRPRGGEPSPEEARTVAEAVGWTLHDVRLDNHSGTRYLIVTPSLEAEDPDPPVFAPPGPAAPVTKDEADARKERVAAFEAEVRAVLLRPGAPWHPTNFTPQMMEARLDALKGLKGGDLRWELKWHAQRWPEEFQDLVKKEP
ncbi:hypothetical protein [Deinococcus radiotolerans]|uniref:Uncharacterized protein n=1 Tax=Deinococcus radiotolerans TaxID=1309407 RepID=A0ABQ2FQE0_9DEIO|nr:hypothetical protein [Deinococcus radiotolerans]GGL16591.1 hypothetical protein GCM10010844_39360 [Deinococcus radiotolerans]